ncbi:hypothetical protein CHS0354_010805 [Potamilus streckersoni]|uniref:Uncharacterized protein n=1 Tax=Potamilus streckersoni TaxID=2493646 RepID=A0AAE0T9D8_9BIVA|nr:hypothetical protein CHS0354_010805 [Potamilus streckersoni]
MKITDTFYLDDMIRYLDQKLCDHIPNPLSVSIVCEAMYDEFCRLVRVEVRGFNGRKVTRRKDLLIGSDDNDLYWQPQTTCLSSSKMKL